MMTEHTPEVLFGPHVMLAQGNMVIWSAKSGIAKEFVGVSKILCTDILVCTVFDCIVITILEHHMLIFMTYCHSQGDVTKNIVIWFHGVNEPLF